MEGKDYVGGTFAVRFRSGETTKLLRIPIIDDMSASGTEEFFEVEQAGNLEEEFFECTSEVEFIRAPRAN